MINIVDLGTGYGERMIASTRTAERMKELLETGWVYRHGAPKTFSADPEFCRPVMQVFLESHGISMSDRPSRSSHKNGIIERNNGTFKEVFKRLSRERTEATPVSLVARASLVTNLLHGSATLSAFQLARGYSPSILGVPSSKVPADLMQAHIEMKSIRAIQKVLKGRAAHTVPPSALYPGRAIWVFYKTSQQNVPVRWVAATVEKAERHFVRCRRSSRGPPMKVAYEHVRLKPQGELTAELSEKSLEDELHDVQFNQTVDAPEGDVDEDSDVMRDIFGSDSEEQEVGIGTRTSFLAEIDADGEPMLDIGMDSASGPQEGSEDLRSDEDLVLKDVYKAIGSGQVTRKSMECAPAWLVKKAVDEEINSNWSEAYEEVTEASVPMNSNVLDSHFVYKIKIEEAGKKRLKARLCPHGNRDRMKGKMRNDSATARFDVIRLLLSTATLLDFSIGCIDIKGAYLQSGPITRTIYVRPPRELGIRGVLWNLLKLPYGISEAGRQWAKTFEKWILEEAGFMLIAGISQLFIRRDKDERITLLLEKITDDLLMAGSVQRMEQLSEALARRFRTRKVVLDSEVSFNGCMIRQDSEGSITLDMTRYMDQIQPIPLDKERKKQREEQASTSEVGVFRTLAGELIWVGCGVLPQATVIGSVMQQSIPRLTVHDLVEANAALKEMKDLRAVIVYPSVSSGVTEKSITTFSDAAFNISSHQAYGQTGVLTGLRMRLRDGSDVYHLIDWVSCKQRRVSHSSYGAEILACTEADDRGFNLKQAFKSIAPHDEIKHTLIVDSKGLYDTISTLHEGEDYRLKQTVQRIRDSFESGDIDVLRWVQGKANIADALTKRNREMHRMLSKITRTGRMDLPRHRYFDLDSKTWT